MLLQNLSTPDIENLLIDETKRYTSTLRDGKADEKEQIRLRIEVLIKVLSERKESNERINQIIKMIDEKRGGQRSPSGNSRNPAS